jgi:hypothetical protein
VVWFANQPTGNYSHYKVKYSISKINNRKQAANEMKHTANKLKNSFILAFWIRSYIRHLKDIIENHTTNPPTKNRTHTPQPQVHRSHQLLSCTYDLIFE